MDFLKRFAQAYDLLLAGCGCNFFDVSIAFMLYGLTPLFSLRRGVRVSSSDFVGVKKFLSTSVIAAAAVAGMAGCAQIKKPVVQARAMAAGLRFDQVGRVTLYVGEPCTPQIMFDFYGAGSTVWLGAPRSETDILTDAARKGRRVHVLGKWRRGGQSNCSYVEVTSAELTR